jgi:integrase
MDPKPTKCGAGTAGRSSVRRRSSLQGDLEAIWCKHLMLHSALLAEGFLDYREGVIREYGDGPLFPQVSLDAYNRRNGKVSKPISKWLRNVVGIRDPNKPFHSHRHTATSFLRNTRLPDGSPAVKEDVERYLLGHAGKGAHAGYGKQWIETLKAAIEIITNPLQAPRVVKDGSSAGS